LARAGHDPYACPGGQGFALLMAQGLDLGFGLHFDDLYYRDGLAQIDGRFL